MSEDQRKTTDSQHNSSKKSATISNSNENSSPPPLPARRHLASTSPATIGGSTNPVTTGGPSTVSSEHIGPGTSRRVIASNSNDALGNCFTNGSNSNRTENTLADSVSGSTPGIAHRIQQQPRLQKNLKSIVSAESKQPKLPLPPSSQQTWSVSQQTSSNLQNLPNGTTNNVPPNVQSIRRSPDQTLRSYSVVGRRLANGTSSEQSASSNLTSANFDQSCQPVATCTAQQPSSTSIAACQSIQESESLPSHSSVVNGVEPNRRYNPGTQSSRTNTLPHHHQTILPARTSNTSSRTPTTPSRASTTTTSSRNQSNGMHHHINRQSPDHDSTLLVTQELVRLDNPRPSILRTTNTYVTIPSHPGETPRPQPPPDSTATTPLNDSRSRITAALASSELKKSKIDRDNIGNDELMSKTSYKNESSPDLEFLDFDRAKIHLAYKLSPENPSSDGISSQKLSQLCRESNNLPSSMESQDPRKELLGEIRPLVRHNNNNNSQQCKHTPHQPGGFFGFRDNSVVLPKRTSNSTTTATPITTQPTTSEPGDNMGKQIGRRNSCHQQLLQGFQHVKTGRNGTMLPETSRSAPSTLMTGSTNRITSRVCGECGGCRCVACGRRRSLPSRWVCNNACLCSAEAVVDTLSCMCCVRGYLFHLHQMGMGCEGEGEEVEDVDLEDEALCSCSPAGTNCFLRWSCLTLACVFIPCLWCYLPLKALHALTAATYAHYHDTSCHCALRADHNIHNNMDSNGSLHSALGHLSTNPHKIHPPYSKESPLSQSCALRADRDMHQHNNMSLNRNTNASRHHPVLGQLSSNPHKIHEEGQRQSCALRSGRDMHLNMHNNKHHNMHNNVHNNMIPNMDTNASLHPVLSQLSSNPHKIHKEDRPHSFKAFSPTRNLSSQSENSYNHHNKQPDIIPDTSLSTRLSTQLSSHRHSPHRQVSPHSLHR